MPRPCTQHGEWEGTQTRCPTCRREEYARAKTKPGEVEKIRARGRAYSQAHRSEYVERARKKYYEDIEASRQYGREKQKLHRQRNRQFVLAAYGGACKCCGEDNEAFLCMDHIDGGGNDHRREQTGDRRGSASAIYKWLHDNNYPAGFQILCANCNMAKERPGGCPHRSSVLDLKG